MEIGGHDLALGALPEFSSGENKEKICQNCDSSDTFWNRALPRHKSEESTVEPTRSVVPFRPPLKSPSSGLFRAGFGIQHFWLFSIFDIVFLVHATFSATHEVFHYVILSIILLFWLLYIQKSLPSPCYTPTLCMQLQSYVIGLYVFKPTRMYFIIHANRPQYGFQFDYCNNASCSTTPLTS